MVTIGIITVLFASVGIGIIYLSGTLQRSSTSNDGASSFSSSDSSQQPVTIYLNESSTHSGASTASNYSSSCEKVETVTTTVTVTANITATTTSAIKVENTITVGSDPYNPAYNPVTNDIYVANLGSSTISVISAATNEVIKMINVVTPYDLWYNPINESVYALTPSPGIISVIGPNNEVDTVISVANPLTWMGFSPANNEVYTESNSGNVVYVINATSNRMISQRHHFFAW